MKEIKIGGIQIGNGIPKICVPIVGRTKEKILEAAIEAEKSEADLVELRMDYYEDACRMEKLIPLVLEIKKILQRKPLIFTFRTKKEGGEKEITEEEYKEINCAVITHTEADLVDIELFTEKETRKIILDCAKKNNTKVILSNHNFHSTPSKEEIIKRLKKMEDLGGDLLKIAVFPKKKEDVLTLLSATLEAKAKIIENPLITISMGQDGLISRMAGEIFGSCITFASLKEASAPGQIPVDKLKDVLPLFHKKEDNLFIIGFMGVGKSTIARELAQKRSGNLIEMDEEIEKNMELSISEIFKTYGETYFRDLESAFIKKIESVENTIVSCGGGVILRKENIDSMKACGKIIYLKARPDTIYERAKNSQTRPILNGNMNLSYIEKLMNQRSVLYEENANIIIETDEKSRQEICEEIVEKAL
ncbi:MAG: type I 3-dehydroquinate dehydratase [Acetivibrio sp.]